MCGVLRLSIGTAKVGKFNICLELEKITGI